jgi:site-specific recombinase XerC
LPAGNSVLDYRDRAILKFFLHSGARLSTACRLKVSDPVALDEGRENCVLTRVEKIIGAISKKPKGSASRRVAYGDHTQAAATLTNSRSSGRGGAHQSRRFPFRSGVRGTAK